VSPAQTTRDIFDEDGYWMCKVDAGHSMVRIQTAVNPKKGAEVPNPWLDPTAARRLALALLAAAIEAEG
jgi:hypothetical protein